MDPNMNRNDRTPDFVGPYRLSQVIFETHNSIVFESYHPEKCQKLAVKLIKKDNVDPQIILDEYQIMSEVEFDYIMPLYDMIDLPHYCALVMPLATGGDLFEYVSTNGQMEEHSACQVIHTALLAIDHLNNLGIWHRDIKPENFLFMNDSLSQVNVVLADLGFAKHFSENEKSSDFIGTPAYCAPEILSHTEYDKSVDIWSLGVTMYVILSGEAPFPTDENEMVPAIISGDYDFDSPAWDDVSEQAKDLIRCMMVVQPERRITVDEALCHPWFQVYFPDHNKPRLEREVQGSIRMNSPFEEADEIDDEDFQVF